MIFSRRNTEAGNSEKALVALLYDRYASWLFAICLRYTGNREDAQDVLQEGFIKIMKGIRHFKPTGNIKFWMRRIMVNTALNYIRDHKKEQIFTELDPGTQMIPEEEGNQEPEISNDKLMEFIGALPSGYRLIFNLYVMEDYSHKEIAEMLGISENTSRTQLLKARACLKKKILEYQSNKRYAEDRRPVG